MSVVFFSYSHKDEQMRNQLETHLAVLKRQGIIETWHDRQILAGDEFAHVISAELERADIVLLLVSPDFLASSYCYDVELARALERHRQGTARVIPVILRACDWLASSFGQITAAPRNGQPIVTWPHVDEAFLDVVKAIRAAATRTRSAPPDIAAAPSTRSAQISPVSPVLPRSSNLRIKQTYSDADKDRFLEEAFDFVAKFFEGSLAELQRRNAAVQTNFRRVDANTFTAAVYRNGKSVSECRVTLGGFIGRGITYSNDAGRHGNGYNECLTAEAGEQALHLKPIMAMLPNQREAQLSFDGAAECLWSKLINRLQH